MSCNNDVDDLNPTRCKVKKEQADFLHEVSVIFWDKYISNDCNLMEALLEQLKMLWEKPRYYVFVCAKRRTDFCLSVTLMTSGQPQGSIMSIGYWLSRQPERHHACAKQLVLCNSAVWKPGSDGHNTK
jgi:hypothetical protein